MKASQLIVQLSTLIAERGDLDVIIQADHHGYAFAYGADFTRYDGEDGTYDCPEEAPEEAKPVIVVYS